MLFKISDARAISGSPVLIFLYDQACRTEKSSFPMPHTCRKMEMP
jgi:hypothetical protein